MGLTSIRYEEGQTPLDPDEADGLLIPTVSTRGELDEVEQRNVEKAVLWTVSRRKRFTIDEVLSEQFILELHNRMYGEVWEWAGRFRNSDKNIGVDKYQIGAELRKLIDDCKYWITNEAYSSPDEIAVRFKHRLVAIHCFSNGNGRHSRLMADIIIEKLFDAKVFTWGGESLIRQSDFRGMYLTALRKADQGDINELMAFARS
jgi:Fic-DOC domain mobile mystery protein B